MLVENSLQSHNPALSIHDHCKAHRHQPTTTTNQSIYEESMRMWCVEELAVIPSPVDRCRRLLIFFCFFASWCQLAGGFLSQQQQQQQLDKQHPFLLFFYPTYPS
ncbi:hypothetical protein PGT21_036255 [Puccinia graminis f. sp. tritici]|uniref:Uncharacterized protein n=1 Tax=Puccinia graminis f. sp. tritici TaxID=56615 RepID=A0A5B0P1X4_PUCGR|nr:hypothetical protein PGT21_036255 [Puccinia graminis f. sp. tritici]